MTNKRDPTIPEKSDPIWSEIVEHPEKFQLSSLPARMLFMRLKLIMKNGTLEGRSSAVDTAYDFFIKNQDALREDIALIFNRNNGNSL